MQRFRLESGGRIDRARPLSFTFDGIRYEGYAGDTLASALLANGVHMVARSFKYHRPRGIHSAGVEEPNALVQLAKVDACFAKVRKIRRELARAREELVGLARVLAVDRGVRLHDERLRDAAHNGGFPHLGVSDPCPASSTK